MRKCDFNKVAKVVIKICNKFTGKHPCERVISIKCKFSCKFAAYFQNSFS